MCVCMYVCVHVCVCEWYFVLQVVNWSGRPRGDGIDWTLKNGSSKYSFTVSLPTHAVYIYHKCSKCVCDTFFLLNVCLGTTWLFVRQAGLHIWPDSVSSQVVHVYCISIRLTYHLSL